MVSPDTLLVITALGLRSLRVAALIGLAFLGLLGTRFGRQRRVLSLPWRSGQIASEAWACARVLVFDAVAALLLWAAVGGSEGLGRLFSGRGAAAALLTFGALFAWYEVWFYALHRALHTRHAWRWHRQHHVAVVCSPLTAFSFSLVERSGLLLGLLVFFSLGVIGVPLSVAGASAYVLLNQVLNILGHSNVEWTPARPGAVWLTRWAVTPTFHALHHARRRTHFGLFTTVLDRALGTVEADYLQALASTSAGQPLAETARRSTARATEAPPRSSPS